MTTSSFPARFAAVLAGEIVNKASVVVAFVYLAQTLDPSVYGEVEWALSLLMVFALAADTGLTTWAAARIAASPREAAVLVRKVGLLRLAFAGPAYAVIALIAAAYGGPAGVALAVYGLVLFLTPFFLQYLFNGLLQTRWVGLGNALRGATFLAVVLLVVRSGSPPVMVAIAEVAGAAALAICHSVVWLSIRGHLPALRARLSTDADARAEAERSAPELTLGHVFRRSWRIGASEITWGVQWYAGLILLGVLSTSTEAAWHSAGLRLVLALHTGVWLYLYVLLPSFARLVKTDAAQWVSLTSQSIRLTGWMGCLVALVGTLAAQPILTTVFGAPYVAAVPVLRALVWVIPIAWMSGHLRYSFIAADRPEKDYHAALAGAGATVLLTIALVPIWQSAGAAVALLGGIMANAAAARVLATGVLPRVAPGRHLLPSAACCAGCLALGFLLAPLAGDIAATLVAGGLLAGTALVVERQTARALAGVFAGAKRERQSVETVS